MSSGCWDPKVAGNKCLFGANDKRYENCKPDTCGNHEHADNAPKVDKPTDPKKQSDWDAYFWYERCSAT